MAATRRLQATLIGAEPTRRGDEVGVLLDFRPLRIRADLDEIRDFASLGPEPCVSSIAGLGKVLRILRAARIALPDEPRDLLGDEKRAGQLLERALGTPLLLELRPRSRIRFVAWTEQGVETIDNVKEVLETPDDYVVIRWGGRFPVRISREDVIRQKTECERWFEVVDVERPPARGSVT